MNNLFLPQDEKKLEELLDRPENVIPKEDVSWPDEWIVFASNDKKFKKESSGKKNQIWLLPHFNMDPILLAERSEPVRAFCIHDNRLYDSGAYGVMDTFNAELVVKRGDKAVTGLCSHDGVLYDCGHYGDIYDTLNDKKVIKLRTNGASMISFKDNFYYATGDNVYGVITNDKVGSLAKKIGLNKMKFERFNKHLYGHAKQVVSLCDDGEFLFSFSRLDNMVARAGTSSARTIPAKDPQFFGLATNFNIYGLESHKSTLYSFGKTVRFTGKIKEVYEGDEPFEFKDTITAMFSVPRDFMEVHLDE